MVPDRTSILVRDAIKYKNKKKEKNIKKRKTINIYKIFGPKNFRAMEKKITSFRRIYCKRKSISFLISFLIL